MKDKYLNFIKNKNVKIIYDNDSQNTHSATYYPSLNKLVFRRKNENNIDIVVHELCHILDYETSKEQMYNFGELVACRSTCIFLARNNLLTNDIFQKQVSYAKQIDKFYVLPRNHKEKTTIDQRIAKIVETLNSI